jgi:uncharacterized protein (DUF1499 family)
MVKRLATAVLALVLLAAAGWYGWQLGPWADAATGEYGVLVDFASLERKASPNQYLVAPDGLTPRAKPDTESPVFSVPPNRLSDAFLAVIAEAPRTTLLNRSADGLHLALVQRTALLRFPDYIDVSIQPAPGEGGDGSTIAIYSRSRFGYSDLGVNRKRVEDWMAALETKAALR